MIELIGPGGAGKTTAGRELAAQLGLRFIDLDHEFTVRIGDISHHIKHRGYESYALANVRLYLALKPTPTATVIALSSGFMTYPANIHPRYATIRSEINESSTTFVLLPSLDLETCVCETVRRQTARPFGRSAETEEAVIRERYTTYTAIPAPRIETMRPVAEIVSRISALLRCAPPAPRAGSPSCAAPS
jgi:shikimate kinase